MANMPLPSPPLDGVPPSPPDLQAQPGANLSQMVSTPNMGGSIQVVQLGLQTAAAIAKGLDLLGQIFPSFAPTAAMLQTQLKSGFSTAIQQGVQGPSEPSPQSSGQGLMSMAQGPAASPPPQSPLPPLQSGF